MGYMASKLLRIYFSVISLSYILSWPLSVLENLAGASTIQLYKVRFLAFLNIILLLPELVNCAKLSDNFLKDCFFVKLINFKRDSC